MSCDAMGVVLAVVDIFFLLLLFLMFFCFSVSFLICFGFFSFSLRVTFRALALGV